MSVLFLEGWSSGILMAIVFQVDDMSEHAIHEAFQGSQAGWEKEGGGQRMGGGGGIIKWAVDEEGDPGEVMKRIIMLRMEAEEDEKDAREPWQQTILQELRTM